MGQQTGTIAAAMAVMASGGLTNPPGRHWFESVDPSEVDEVEALEVIHDLSIKGYASAAFLLTEPSEIYATYYVSEGGDTTFCWVSAVFTDGAFARFGPLHLFGQSRRYYKDEPNPKRGRIVALVRAITGDETRGAAR